MAFQKYKKIEDSDDYKRILKSVKVKNRLFAYSTGYETDYYFYLDNKFYNVNIDNYNSMFFGEKNLYEISLDYFLEKFEAYKEDTKDYDDKDYKKQEKKVEKFLEENKDKLLEEQKNSLILQINDKIAELQDLFNEAKESGVTDEWTIYQNGVLVKPKNGKKLLLESDKSKNKE